MGQVALVIFIALIGLFILTALFLASRYKRCPSDKILVIYGRTGNGSARCIHGGASMVWPVIQDYQYLDLTPISIDVDLKGALSKQNIRVDVPSQFTVGVSNEEGVMQNAAERLLGIDQNSIRGLAYNIIVGQMRLVIATMDIEEINVDRDKFLENVKKNVGAELRKIGLQLINVNVTDIQDESGYIHALGQEAAAKAINDAKMNVAEKDRDGAIGQANARKDQTISVSSAEASAQVGEADAEAKAIDGQNIAKIKIAESNAERRQKEAEYLKLATASEKIQAAKALEEAYLAEQVAEEARGKKEMATRQADAIVQAEIAKQKLVIEANAEAEQIRALAQGEADAIFLKKEAEAKGMFEVLSKQAQGFEKIVQATGGNSKDAVLMLIADKLEVLVEKQVEAIKNIKIDKVTVWEGGNKEGEGNSTSKFVSGLYKSVPPLNDLFNMAGMDLPQYLGSAQGEELPQPKQAEPIELAVVEKNGEA